jgi:hypothetical protein
MAFDVDLTGREKAAIPVDGILKNFLMKRSVDFTVVANQVASGKVCALFQVPAYVLVEEVFYDVQTAEANVTDIDIGSFTTAGVGVAATGFMEAKSLAALGLIRALSGKTYSRQDGTAGYFSQSPWVIGLTNDDADTIATAVVDFFAVCMNLV